MSVAADALPDDPPNWLYQRLQDVVWADDPVRQIAANLLLFMAALVSSTVTLGATLILSVIFLHVLLGRRRALAVSTYRRRELTHANALETR